MPLEHHRDRARNDFNAATAERTEPTPPDTPRPERTLTVEERARQKFEQYEKLAEKEFSPRHEKVIAGIKEIRDREVRRHDDGALLREDAFNQGERIGLHPDMTLEEYRRLDQQNRNQIFQRADGKAQRYYKAHYSTTKKFNDKEDRERTVGGR